MRESKSNNFRSLNDQNPTIDTRDFPGRIKIIIPTNLLFNRISAFSKNKQMIRKFKHIQIFTLLFLFSDRTSTTSIEHHPINFPLRFLYVNFKISSKITNLNWFFAQTRKILTQGFFVSFRFIRNFQNSNKVAIIFIKISIIQSKFAKNS